MISRSSYLIELVSRYPLRFFVIGILLFQVLVLGSAGILSWRWPSSESSWNADPVSLESSAEVSQDLVSSIETGEEQDNSAGLFASIDIDRLQAAQSEEDTEAMFTEAVDYDQIGAELGVSWIRLPEL